MDKHFVQLICLKKAIGKFNMEKEDNKKLWKRRSGNTYNLIGISWINLLNSICFKLKINILYLIFLFLPLRVPVLLE